MDYQTVLEFWFGEDYQNTDTAEIVKRQSKLWWSKNADIDNEILQRFEPVLKALISGLFSHWRECIEGRLAAIIVLDQFSRNMYRGSVMSFTQDALALHWSLEAINAGDDKQLRPLERVFLYMPLEHSEQLIMQKLSLEKFQQLKDDAPASFAKDAEGYLHFAQRHLDIIHHFGRFPHRNAILNRESSEEEKEFLTQPGSGF